MRVVIVGAGAVGGYLAAKLAAAGVDVVVLARGPALAAIAGRGLEVRGQESIATRVRTAAAAAEVGHADLVVTCVKAYSIPPLAPALVRLLAGGGTWLCAVNGLPWWYGEGLGGALGGLVLDRVDPGGAVAAAVGRGRTLGCVLYLRAEVLAPGVVACHGGRGLLLGEPEGPASARLAAVCRLFTEAGVAAAPVGDIRAAVWTKLYGNVALNPLSAITGLTADRLLADPALRGFMAGVMAEAQRIAAAAGSPPELGVEARLARMAELGAFRTSMLQDAEAGRPLEHDAIVGAVVELGRRLAVELPHSELLWALIRSFAEARGLLVR